MVESDLSPVQAAAVSHRETGFERDYVFLGPTLDASVARTRFAGTMLPPVGRGDLDALLASNPRRVGIVDGRFLQSFALTPKEVLRALDGGVELFGAASMGALRAVECAPYGMVGVGEVFRMYMDGEIDADDEVAMTFDPETFTPTSEPLVNIRAAMKHAVGLGRIAATTGESAVGVAQGLYFPDRTWAIVAEDLRAVVEPTELDCFWAYVSSPDRLNQKAVDALAMLDLMSRSPAGGDQPATADDDARRDVA